METILIIIVLAVVIGIIGYPLMLAKAKKEARSMSPQQRNLLLKSAGIEGSWQAEDKKFLTIDAHGYQLKEGFKTINKGTLEFEDSDDNKDFALCFIDGENKYSAHHSDGSLTIDYQGQTLNFQQVKKAN